MQVVGRTRARLRAGAERATLRAKEQRQKAEQLAVCVRKLQQRTEAIEASASQIAQICAEASALLEAKIEAEERDRAESPSSSLPPSPLGGLSRSALFSNA